MDRSTSPALARIWRRQHPITKGIIGVAAFVAVAEVLISLIPPAWAGVSIPIGRYTIELGELPQWITALVAAGGLWKAMKAEKNAADAKTYAASAAKDSSLAAKDSAETNTRLEAVAHVIDGMRTAAEAAKVEEGRAQVHAEIAATEVVEATKRETVRSDAVADAEAAAKVRTAEALPATPLAEAGPAASNHETIKVTGPKV